MNDIERREKTMQILTQDQIAAIVSAELGLRSDVAMLRADREGASNIRAAQGDLEKHGVAGTCGDAITLIRAALKGYEQGNDRVAISHAETAAGILHGIAERATADRRAAHDLTPTT